MKNLLIVASFALLALTACKKNIETPNQEHQSVQSFKEIKSNEAFNWQTERELTLKVQGLATQTKIVNTFKVSSMDGTIVYASSLQAMDQNWEQKIRIPVALTEIKISYGSITKTYKTAASTIEFDYLPEITEEIL